MHNKHNYDFFNLLEKQRILMNITDIKFDRKMGSTGDVIIWLLAECGEVLNEAKFFKYCRDKSINKDRLLSELTDCLFLYLELAVRTDFHKSYGSLPGGSNYDVITSNDDLHLEFAQWIRLISRAYGRLSVHDKDYVCILHNSMDTLFSLFNYYGFTQEEITSMYYKKYETNLIRLKEFNHNA